MVQFILQLEAGTVDCDQIICGQSQPQGQSQWLVTRGHKIKQDSFPPNMWHHGHINCDPLREIIKITFCDKIPVSQVFL